MTYDVEAGEADQRTARRQGCGFFIVLVLNAIGWMVVENNAAPRRMSVLQAELRAHGVAGAKAYPIGRGQCARHEVEYIWKTPGGEGRACVTVREAQLLPD